MGSITMININNLFWLGRYVERVFTTLNSFFEYSDKFIEGGQEAYENYLMNINVPNIYENSEDFFKRYVFDISNPDSIIANLDRALGNGIVLRDEIKTPSLAYLQLAMDRFKACEGTNKIRYDMLPVRDALYAFWGSVDNNMTNADARRIIHIGKSVERADMYLRLGFPSEKISEELDNLLKHISRYDFYENTIVNADACNELKSVIRDNIDIDKYRNDILENVEKLIEVNIFEAASI